MTENDMNQITKLQDLLLNGVRRLECSSNAAGFFSKVWGSGIKGLGFRTHAKSEISMQCTNSSFSRSSTLAIPRRSEAPVHT